MRDDDKERRHPNRAEKRALSAAELALFVKQYSRRAQRGCEPNDRKYDRDVEQKVLRMDPFEEADHIAMDYGHWRIDRVFLLVPAQEYIARYIATFKEFPPSQKVGSFSLDQVLETLTGASTSGQ